MDENKYSSDNNRVAYQQDQTNTLYVINYFLYYLYYAAVLFFLIRTYKYYLVNNKRLYLNLAIYVFLLAYPYIVYPIQYLLFRWGTQLYDRFHSNVYLSANW